MGVGTNYFPMEVSKVPKLQTLVTELEFRHIEAFPSILRLLNHGPLIDELDSALVSFDQIESITFHRVIDNKELNMKAEDFWVHLNYQIIHILDFLPTIDWEQEAGNNFLHAFSRLHTVLTKAGKLE